MALDYKDRAKECYKNEDYKGYLENAKKQYSSTGSEEDLEEYEKAKKIVQLAKEVQQIIDSEKEGHYKVLGVGEDASIGEIKKAFRDKASRYHPDRARVKGSHDAMRIVQKAYFEINTEEKKAAYDNRSKMPRFVRNFIPNTNTDFFMATPSFTYTNAGGSFAFSTTFSPQLSPFEFSSGDFGNLYSSLYRNTFNRYRRRPGNAPSPNIMSLVVFFVLIVLILLS